MFAQTLEVSACDRCDVSRKRTTAHENNTGQEVWLDVLRGPIHVHRMSIALHHAPDTVASKFPMAKLLPVSSTAIAGIALGRK